MKGQPIKGSCVFWPLRLLSGQGPRAAALALVLACLGAWTASLFAQPPSEFRLSDQESEVYYRFAVVAGEDLQVEGGTQITGNVHSNDKADLKKDSRVTGDVSVVGKLKNKGTVVGEVRPGADLLGLPVLLSEAALRALADRLFEHDVTFTNAVIDDVVFVAGKVKVEGSLGGVGTIIATRDLRIGKEEWEGEEDSEAMALEPGSRLSLISLEDVRIGKNRPFRGVVRAGRDAKVEKNAAFEGVIVAGRKVEIKKDSRITFVDFDPVAPVVTLLTPADGGFVATATPEIAVALADEFSGLRLDSIELLLDAVDRSAEAVVEGASPAVTVRLIPSPPLTDGLHTVEVAVTDPSDNEGSGSFSFVTDTLAPSLAILSPSSSPLFSVVPEIVVEYGDATSGVDLATVEVAFDGALLVCAVDGGSASCPPPPGLAAGPHTVSAAVRDRAGNLAGASFPFELILDLEAPAITVTSPTDGSTVTDPALSVTGIVTDPSGVAAVTVNGQAATLTGENFSATLTLLPGLNTITVAATDAVGNSGSVTLTVTLAAGDTTPPTLTILAPKGGVFLTNARPLIEVRFSDADSGVDQASLAFTANGAPLAAACLPQSGGASCTPETPLPEGSVTLAATIRDNAGNGASASVLLTVDTVGVQVTLTGPAAGLITRDAQVTASGTVGPGVNRVEVNGVVAALSGSSFSAAVPLREGVNMVVALAIKANGNTGTASVDVTRDIVAPIVRIDSPRDGFVSVSNTVAVTGVVNDIVTGGVNPTVTVNGVPVAVANGAFVLPNLQLVNGPNTIQAVATDAVGNVGAHSITVRSQKPVGARIGLAAGNGQSGLVRAALAQPLVVAVTDDLGNPVAGRVVTFEVTRNSGTLRTASGALPRRSVQVPTDGAGRASVLLTLGDTSGEGNNRVRATGLGVAGEVEFCATARGADPDKILMTMGDNQRGLVGHPLATSLEALVVDADGNPLPAVLVTFEVVRGSGSLDGQPSLLRMTDVHGVARAVLKLGLDAGINNNVVAASFAGLTGLQATFTASGLAAGDPAQTRLSGVVLDNSQTPIPGAVVSIGGTALTAITSDQGQFTIHNVPVGHVTLDIDPSGSPRSETFPHLAFETVTVAGQNNTIGQPILIPAVDTASAQIVGGSQPVTLTMAGVAGLSLTVFPNSVTFPNGATTGLLSISQVHLDKVPMQPPNGSFFMPPAWTIQPAGVHFDPPARITIPNDGLPAGRVIDIFQFDHTLNQFINVGKGTVSDDAFVITSDPGFGITRAGWGGCGLPQPPQTCGSGCDDMNPCTQDRCENNSCVHTPNADGTACMDEGDMCTMDVCMAGACAHPPVECEECQRCRDGDCEADPAMNMQPCMDEGDPACTVDRCMGDTCQHTPAPPITPHDPDPYPLDTANLNQATSTGLNCLRTAVTNAGGTFTTTSAYRPQSYQDHLREVAQTRDLLMGWTEAECAASIASVNTEVARHGRIMIPARVSQHSQGNAFDAAITLPAGTNVDTLATGCGLRRPLPQRDPVHFISN